MALVVSTMAYLHKTVLDSIVKYNDEFFNDRERRRLNYQYAPIFPQAPDSYTRRQFEELRQDKRDVKDLPLLTWSRSPIQAGELGERVNRDVYSRNPNDTQNARILNAFQGKVEYTCTYMTNSHEDLDNFEIFYTSYIPPIFNATVNFESIYLPSPLCYTIEKGEVTEIVAETDEYVNHALGFSLTAQGMFYIFSGEYPYLQEIITTSYDVYGNPLHTRRTDVI